VDPGQTSWPDQNKVEDIDVPLLEPSENGKIIYTALSNLIGHAVAAIDIATHKVLANIQFARGPGPKRILVAPKVR